MNKVFTFLTILAWIFGTLPIVIVVLHFYYCERSVAYRIEYGDVSFVAGKKGLLLWLVVLVSWVWIIAGWIQ